MYLESLELQNFRNYREAQVSFPKDGVIVLHGRNGHGKTNLLEAICYITSLRSFRTPTHSTLIRSDADSAIVRGSGGRNKRELLVESEISQASGRSKTLINKQQLRKTSDFVDVFASVVFAPDDLSLIKAGPGERRDYMDDILSSSDKRVAALRHDVDRVLKQRNTLLRQANGKLSSDIESTLDVWDERLTNFGETLAGERDRLIKTIHPFIEEAYDDIAGTEKATIGLKLLTNWRVEDGHKGLAEALKQARTHDIARSITSVGPHRDELHITIDNLPARTHASQGEQRTLALAMRLATFRYLESVLDDTPVLLLDDVFSELDEVRSQKLLTHLTKGQMFITTATEIPFGFGNAMTFEITEGTIARRSQ